MMRVRKLLRSYTGWCPMNSTGPGRISERESVHSGSPGVGGSVKGRVAIFTYLTWTVISLSYLVAILALPSLPEIIPVHWNVYGEADGFANSFPGVFGLPVIITLCTIILMILPRFEEIQVNIRTFPDIYQIVIFTLAGTLFAMELVVLLISAGYQVRAGIIIPMFLGILFVVVGSLMPYIGRNTIIGIRLPWTLRDEDIWKKTHERGGPAFVIAGFLMVIMSPAAGTFALPLMMVILGGVILYITGYSYHLEKVKRLNHT